MKRNLDFKMLSLNVRGIRSFDKRKALFNWIGKERIYHFFARNILHPRSGKYLEITVERQRFLQSWVTT